MPHIRREIAAALRIRTKPEIADTARLRIRDAAALRRRSHRDKRGNRLRSHWDKRGNRPRSHRDKRGNRPRSHWDNRGDGRGRGTGAPSNPNAAQLPERAVRTAYNRTGYSRGCSTGGSRRGCSFDNIHYSPGMPYVRKDKDKDKDKDRNRRFVRGR